MTWARLSVAGTPASPTRARRRSTIRRRPCSSHSLSRSPTTETQADGSVKRTLRELLEVVEQLRPIIEANAPLAEAERKLQAEVFDAMRDGGLFDMQTPRLYGGLKLHPVETMRVGEAVARIDSAAAWNLVMNQAVGGFAAWLPEEGARELFGDGPTTVAGAFFPGGGDAGRRRLADHRTGTVPSGCDNARVVPDADSRDGRCTPGSTPQPVSPFPSDCSCLGRTPGSSTRGSRGSGKVGVPSGGPLWRRGTRQRMPRNRCVSGLRSRWAGRGPARYPATRTPAPGPFGSGAIGQCLSTRQRPSPGERGRIRRPLPRSSVGRVRSLRRTPRRQAIRAHAARTLGQGRHGTRTAEGLTVDLAHYPAGRKESDGLRLFDQGDG